MKWNPGNYSGITWKGRFYTIEEIRDLNLESLTPFEVQLVQFLKEWGSDSPFLTIPTSGSTGTPKEIEVEKIRMLHSARITCSFLGLKGGDRALLCMPLDFIAGKMMVVRALAARLDLVTVPPSSHPFSGVYRDIIGEAGLDLAALVPLQVHQSLENEEERDRLRSVRHLLIGGGAIDPALEQELQTFPHAVWSTYGMTETLSHIALRRINGRKASAFYSPLEGVSLSLSGEGTLVIDAPALSPEILVTHDRAELLPDGRFRVLGRKDNVICSGGVKIQTEMVETILASYLTVPFALSWVTDEKLGQCVVLLLETDCEGEWILHQKAINQALTRFQRPRHVLYTSSLPRTETGKPARWKIQLLCEELVKKTGSEE